MATSISFTDIRPVKKKKKEINTGYFTPICNTAICGVTTGKNIDGKLFFFL